MVTIHMWSNKKGSNPGGKCKIAFRKNYEDFYIKYCTSSQLPKDHPFYPNAQPFYEALTLVMAEGLGIEVPDYFVLRNCKENIRITHNGFTLRNKLDEHRPNYFLSKLVELPKQKNDEACDNKMKEERLYRKLLMIADLSNKKQNYAYFPDHKPPHILYIDVGCNFVDAISGTISQRNEVSDLIRDRRGLQLPYLKRSIKNAKHWLEHTYLTTNHKNSYQRDIICLNDFIDAIPNYEIPLFPNGKISAKDVLFDQELDEIMNLMRINMARTGRKFFKDGDERITRE